MALELKLEIFEGPLDLLLHLIRTMEVDIYDIPISEITKQYMKYLETMQTLQLEVAGEYAVMAATLMALKSRMLLPAVQAEIEDDAFAGEDPREDLIQQLLAYRKFKYAAGELQKKETQRAAHYLRAPKIFEIQEKTLPLSPNAVTTIDLFLAFQEVLAKQYPHDNAQVHIDEIHIETQKEKILARLAKVEILDFGTLFTGRTKEELVMTFLAVLELMKEQMIDAVQPQPFDEIRLIKKEIEGRANE